MRPLGEWQFHPLAVRSGNRQADPNQVSMSSQHRSSDNPPVAMRLLASGVPLRLLLDLAAPDGPDSEVIAATEETGHH